MNNPSRGAAPGDQAPGQRGQRSQHGQRVQRVQDEPHAQPHELAQEITRRLEQDAGVDAVVEIQGNRVILSGRVDTAEAKQAASDIVAMLAPDKQIDNDLDVEVVSPTKVSIFHAGVAQSAMLPDDVGEIRAADSSLDPDFMARPNDDSSLHMAGVDTYEESENVYEPPTDPVVTIDQNDNVQVLGGFAHSSMESVAVERSSDGTLGDEAIAEAILRELREDAATTALTIDVTVRQGVAHLRGTVPDVIDAENAEAVASRVPGVVEVREELTVESI
jgi:osmotically-inducible protein OsmY